MVLLGLPTGGLSQEEDVAMHRWLTFAMMSIPMTVAAQPSPVPAVPVVKQWMSFRDPQENAFTLDVPQGWPVQGGTARRNALQFRNWVQVTAPDGNTVLAINDPTEGSYVVPTQMLAMAGFHEGSIYGGGGGTAYTVAGYRTGAQFAAAYGQAHLREFCQNVSVTDVRGLPQLTQMANAIGSSYGMHHDAGEASFACVRHGVPMQADLLASVLAISGAYGTIWYAEWFYGFVAPTPLAGVAAGTLMHMLQSIQVNPQWVSRTTQTNMDVSHIAAQTNQAISNTLMQAWESKGAVMDRIMNEGSRARLGIDIYRDPASGTEYTVANTYQHYWANAAGVVVGTDTDTAPNGFSRLARVPP
jgi:hypothetical protein